jgi:hypothetical protein
LIPPPPTGVLTKRIKEVQVLNKNNMEELDRKKRIAKTKSIKRRK